MTPYTQNIKLCRITAFSLCLLILGTVAGGSFGVIWLRQGLATNAKATKSLQAEIVQAERRSVALEARIAKAHSPQYLTARSPVDLRPTNPDQIVWMPRAQLLSPADYMDPTLAQPVPSAPAAHVIAESISIAAEPADAVVAAEEATPQIISFDLALSTVNEPARRARSQ